MPCRFLMVCEAEADFRTVSRLAERVICELVPWMDDDLLKHCPIWFEVEPGRPFLKWAQIKTIAVREGIPGVRGEFDGRGGRFDAPNARRVFRLFEKWQYEGKEVHGVLLIRDHDGIPERGEWLNRVRESEKDISDTIVIGIAHHERECWALAGYCPSTEQEEEAINQLRARLGFDPCVDSHRLTAEDSDERSAKHVLGLLTDGNEDREAACWAETPLATLRERGEASGLRAFLGEVEERLVPLFTGRPFERQHPTD